MANDSKHLAQAVTESYQLDMSDSWLASSERAMTMCHQSPCTHLSYYTSPKHAYYCLHIKKPQMKLIISTVEFLKLKFPSIYMHQQKKNTFSFKLLNFLGFLVAKFEKKHCFNRQIRYCMSHKLNYNLLCKPENFP